MLQIKSTCLTILLMTVQWMCVDSCTCDQHHPQYHFCNADFAIAATPTELIVVNSQTNAYSLTIHEVFKATAKGQVVITNNIVYTGNNVGLCGSNLQLNQKYLLVGGVANGKGYINLCGFNTLFSSVSPQQLLGLKGLYAKGCKCKIKLCLDADCSTLTYGKMCVAAPYDKLSCFYRYGACVPAGEECQWTDDCRVDACVGLVI